MRILKRWTTIGLPILAVAALTVAAVAFTRSSQEEHKGASDPSTLSLIEIGQGNLSSAVSKTLRSRGARLLTSSTLDGVFVDGHSTLVFDGQWMAEHRGDTAVRAVVTTAVQQGAGVVMIGGQTSRLLEVLQSAGVYQIPETESGQVRNPAYFDPPLVGFKIQNSTVRSGPSLLLSNSDDTDTLANALLGWR